MTAPRSLAEAPKKTLAERGPSIHDAEGVTPHSRSSPRGGLGNLPVGPLRSRNRHFLFTREVALLPVRPRLVSTHLFR
jgi:hypothetical protein